MRPACLLALLVSAPALALEQRVQGWFLGMAQAPVLGDGLVYVELQPRGTLWPAEVAKLDQVIARAAVGWQLHRTFSVWVGGAYVGGEQRIFEQLMWGESFGPVRLSVRARLEQRWLPQAEGARHRARVQVRLAWTFKEPFLLVVYDEPFVNFPFELDQNRAYVALGIRAHERVLIEVGYLNQLLPARMAHTPILSVGVGF